MSEAVKGSDRGGGVCAHRVGPGGFALKKLLRSILESPDFEEALKGLDIPPEKIISPLLCFLCETGGMIRWRAIRGVGIIVSAMAGKDLESARIIVRRLIWSLNDESGGIGWGAPEAMGEIMAENEALAGEYHRILVSYIDEKGNLLENDEIERGVMWAIGRLAQKRPELLRDWTGPVLARLNSPDPVKRGLALRTLILLSESHIGRLQLDPAARLLPALLDDQSEIRIFQDGAFEEHKICSLATELLNSLNATREARLD
jgi:hypothetical protein